MVFSPKYVKIRQNTQVLLIIKYDKQYDPTYKGAVMSGLGCQSDEAARVVVKRH